MGERMDKHNFCIFNFKFVIKLFLLLFMIACFCFHLSPQYTNGYNASLIDKVDRLTSIDEAKIVLIGNSNLAFGIDSEKIEAAFEMPVVNMGLHGDLGNVFHERMAELNVHEGDIYIISHTNFSDDGAIYDRNLAWITLENHIRLWRILRCEDYLPMIKSYPNYLKRCTSLWLGHSGNLVPNNVYSRAAFNEYGDIEWEDNGLEHTFSEGEIWVPEISDNVVERLNKLNTNLRERGAILFIAAYPIAQTEYTPEREAYIEFQKILKEKLDAPVISDYTDYIYPKEYFYNTALHLNNVGKKIRTLQLIQDIKNQKNTLYE